VKEKTMGQEKYPISTIPTKELSEPGADGITVDIILVLPNGEELTGYYDPKGCISGGKFFYYENRSIKDCATLKNFPTHWYYAEEE
jgi:hypothetical protein